MSRIRSLLAFRHRNPAGRLLSMLIAFAIAALLVSGTGAAYADDGSTPDPAVSSGDTGSTTEDPAPATEDPAPATEDPAPATEDPAPATEDPAPADPGADAPAGDPAPESAPAEQPKGDAPTATSSAHAGSMMTALKKLAADPNAAPTDVTVPCRDPWAGTMVGGFEIDGDLCVNNSGEDWDGLDFGSDSADYVVDGFDDNTTFTQGDSENNDPSTWHIDGPTPNGKSDIGTAYAYSKSINDDVFGYFAFSNTSTAGGTQQYDVEYNQNEATKNGNGATVPVREPGDLLFRFSSIGNDPLVFTDAKIYTLESSGDWDANACFSITSSSPAGGWCTLPIPPNAFESAASDDGLFQEGSIKISAFFGEGDCSGVFGTTQIRSVTGNSFATSALKDYVYPLDVTTPSTCGSLRLEKKDVDSGAPAGGGVYQIVGDPRPGGDPDPAYQLCIYDGPAADLASLDIPSGECDEVIADGTADGSVNVGEVEPGTYTVTEIVPPPGYLLNPEPDPGNSFDVTLGEGESETVTFENHKKWDPLTVSKTADGTYSAAYTWAIEKQIAPTADGPWSDGTTAEDPLVKTVDLGGDTSLYYQVVVTQESRTTSDYVVSGSIHVANPNDAAVHATIDESLDGCTIAGAADPATVDVPAGGADYAYTCDLGDGPVDPGTNTATVTWDKSTYPQTTDDIDADGDFSAEGSDDYTFAETSSTDKTVTVTDDHFTFDPAWVITWGDEEDGMYESAVYSFDTGASTEGACSDVVTNTVSLTGDDEEVLGQTSENGQVCIPAAVIPPSPPVVEPPEVSPPSALPNTGGPDAGILAAGVALLLGGSLLVLGDRRRRRRG